MRLFMVNEQLLGLVFAFFLCHIDSTAEPNPAQESFDATRAGEERTIAGVKLCWCPPGKFTMGSPPDEPERRPGEDQVEVTLTRGFWAGKYEVDAGRLEARRRKAAGRADRGAARGGRLPRRQRQLRRGRGVLPRAHRAGPQVGRAARGLGVPAAHRGAVGVRLPGRDHDRHGVRRQAEQQAGELQGQAVQRRRGGAVAGQGGEGRQLPGERLGPARHARQHLRVVPRLVPREAARRRRSGPARRAGHGGANRTGDSSRSRRGGAWTDDGWPCRSAFRLRFEPERRYDHIGFRVVAVQKIV